MDPTSSTGGRQIRFTTATTSERTIVDVTFNRWIMRWDHRLSVQWRNAVLLGVDRTGFDESDVSVTNHMVGGQDECRSC
jgi:hypothetical protein